MTQWNRRKFLVGSLAGSVAGSCAVGASSGKKGGVGGPKIRISCNAYSFNGPLSEGTMSVDEFLEFLTTHDFDAVDLTGYYLPGYPAPPPPEEIFQIKRRAFELGLEINATGVRNDFTLPDPEKRRAEVEHVKRWIEVAAKLGASSLRVFTGREEAESPPQKEIYRRVADSLQECADHGSRHGVIVALQNHAELLKSSEDILRLLEMVDSDWLGLNLDIGSFRTTDPYSDIAKVAPLAVAWQIKENVYFGEKQVSTDLARIIEIVKGAGYRGYLSLETLGEGDPRTKLPDLLRRFREALQRPG